jgi:hypothetical protein
MGGGGGGGSFSRPIDPSEIRKDLAKAQDAAKRRDYDAQVSKLLDSILTAANQRDASAIEKHLSEISTALSAEIEGTINFLFGGSVAKHTFVDGISDVDTLVILNDTNLKSKSPSEVLTHFAKELKDRFPKTKIDIGNLAVTVKFGDIDVQLLPALKTTGDKLKIPGSDKKSWLTINPKAFTDKLTAANKNLDGRLIPTIKLAKSIMSNLPESHQLTGYHTEALAAEIYDGYKGDKGSKALLAHFFTSAPEKVLTPLKDATGQSREVDSYLGAAGSTKRAEVASVLGRIGRVMKAADDLLSTEPWKKLL